MPQLIVYSNLLPFISLVVLLFLIYKNPLFHRQQNRLFQIAVIVTLVMLIVISIDYTLLLSENGDVWPLRRMTSFMNFAIAPLVPLLLYRIFAREKQPTIFYLPCIVNVLLCAFSVNFGWVFLITVENQYDRGPLFFVPFAISILYLLILLYGSGAQRQGGKRSERLFLAFVILLLAFGMFFEIILAYNFLSWDVVAVSLVLYYLLLNINNSTTDPLTGAFNRPMYTAALAKAGGGDGFIIAVLDINDFKKINDEQGHDAGDRCLQLFVTVMQQNLPKGMQLYRVGGDEFAIITKQHTPDALLEGIAHARVAIRTQQLDFAYGIARYTPGTDLEETIRAADQAMYTNKRQLKHAEAPPVS